MRRYLFALFALTFIALARGITASVFSLEAVPVRALVVAGCPDSGC